MPRTSPTSLGRHKPHSSAESRTAPSFQKAGPFVFQSLPSLRAPHAQRAPHTRRAFAHMRGKYRTHGKRHADTACAAGTRTRRTPHTHQGPRAWRTGVARTADITYTPSVARSPDISCARNETYTADTARDEHNMHRQTPPCVSSTTCTPDVACGPSTICMANTTHAADAACA